MYCRGTISLVFHSEMSLELLRRVKETEVINTKCMLQLYNALVHIPQLEYAASVWQIGICSGLDERFGLVSWDPGHSRY